MTVISTVDKIFCNLDCVTSYAYLWPADGVCGCQMCLSCSVKMNPYCHRNRGPPVHAGLEHSTKPGITQKNTVYLTVASVYWPAAAL